MAQVVCPLVPVHDMCRLIAPNSFFDLCESLNILPVNYFCSFPVDDMLSVAFVPSQLMTWLALADTEYNQRLRQVKEAVRISQSP